MAQAPFDRGTLAEQAARWHVRQREGGLDAATQARFMQWLLDSPEHLREYLAVARTAGELAAALRALPATPAAPPLPAPRPDNVVLLPVRPRARSATPPHARTRHWRATVAAVLGLVLLGGGVQALRPRTTEYVAAHAAPRTLQLDDGSVVHLNADSALRVRLGPFARQVELTRGQASFVVAADRRPFRVRAAGLQVRDIGTTFDVALLREQARIGVSEGRVQVLGDGDAAGLLADLGAGESARIDYRDQQVTLSREDPQAITAWWQRRIVFRDEPLAEVADAFNRLNRVRLQVDEAAGALRLTGSLRGDDIASLRAFLEHQPQLQVRMQGQLLLVGMRDGAPAPR